MKIPDDCTIPEEKITHYLLESREKDDKSKFLAQGGFSKENPEELKSAIKKHSQNYEAIKDVENEYGEFYTVKGDLEGTNGTFLKIISVWLKRKVDRIFQFITLKPWKN